MGRKAKPAAEKELAGNPGKRALVTDEQLDAQAAQRDGEERQKVLDQGDFVRPDFVTGFGEEFWEDHVDRLRRLRLLRAIDIQAFAMICVSYDLMRQALDQVREKGAVITVETRHGVMPRRNPAFDIFKQAAREVRDGMAEFGLTPSGRARAALGALDPPAQKPGQGALPLAGEDRNKDGSGPVGFIHRAGSA